MKMCSNKISFIDVVHFVCMGTGKGKKSPFLPCVHIDECIVSRAAEQLYNVISALMINKYISMCRVVH